METDDAAKESRLAGAWRATALTLASILAIATVSLAWLPAPWVWIGAGSFAVLSLAAWRAPGPGALFFNLGIACLVLGLVEANAWRQPAFRFEREPPGDYAVPDDDLGYRPNAVGPTRTRRYLGDQLVYDVVYTLGEDGLRIAPPATRDAPCVLFFGGSFTFGEGVADDETLPWQVGLLTRGPVYNFAFHGYGPHQMLASIEGGRVERIVSCTPTHAVYQAVSDHVNRLVGSASWDRHGPRYELDASGEVLRRGHFDDGESAGVGFLREQLEKSRLVAQWNERRRATTPEDVALFAAVVARARDELIARHPGIEFHALLWDGSGAPGPEFWLGLERRGVPVHRISEVMPGHREGDSYFTVSPLDDHPNAIVQRAIARYVARRIVAQGDRARRLDQSSDAGSR